MFSQIEAIITSAVLILEEGDVEFDITMELPSIRVIHGMSFDLQITTEMGWEPVQNLKTVINETHGNRSVTFSFAFNSQLRKLIPYNQNFEDGNYNISWPCLKVQFYADLLDQSDPSSIEHHIREVSVKTTVSNVFKLKLSNAEGEVYSTIPFCPFGSFPEVGSYLRMECPLIFHRHLSNLEFTFDWNSLPDLPGGFEEYYKAYEKGIHEKVFKARLSQTRILGNTEIEGLQEIELFDMKNSDRPNNKSVNIDLDNFNFSSGIDTPPEADNAQNTTLYLILTEPEMAFGHMIFPELYSQSFLNNSKTFKKKVDIPNQPYTPVLEKLMVSYSNVATMSEGDVKVFLQSKAVQFGN